MQVLPALLIRISIVENASGKEAMEMAFLSRTSKSKVCTSVSFESSFQVQPFGSLSTAKDNFIIVLLRFRRLLYRFR
jgi:hypothetical protein